MQIPNSRKIALLFKKMTEGERDVEKARQELALEPTFEPLFAFQRLDFKLKGHLTPLDIKRFLQGRHIAASSEEVLELVEFYDRRCEQSLDYSDFLNLALTANRKSLRETVIARKAFHDKVKTDLPSQVSNGLGKIFEAELRLLREVKAQREELRIPPGFGIYTLFANADPEKSHYISASALHNFMVSEKLPLDKEAVQDLLRRFDRDRDGNVSYLDFDETIMGVPRKPRHEVLPQSLGRDWQQRSAPREHTRAKITEKVFASPEPRSKRLMETRIKQVRNTDPEIDLPGQFSEELMKKLQLKQLSEFSNQLESPEVEETQYVTPPKHHVPVSPDSGETAAETAQKPYYGSLEKIAPELDPEAEIGLVKLLRAQAALDRDLEDVKQAICSQPDYNTLDLLAFFDTNNQKSITVLELKNGFERLGLNQSSAAFHLLLKRYDGDVDGKLSVIEFTRMVEPRDEKHLRALHSRVPQAHAGELVFCAETQKYLRALLSSLVDTEVLEERVRKQQFGLGYSIKDSFNHCDVLQKGYLTAQHVHNFMKKNKSGLTHFEVQLLMERYDKDQDGKISFKEFMREAIPSRTINA